MNSIELCTTVLSIVEPPNKRHFGDTASVLILEVVLFSEVKKLLLWYKDLEECPL